MRSAALSRVAATVLIAALVPLLIAPAPVAAQSEGDRELTVDDAFAIAYVSDPQPSPGGDRIAYVVRTASLEDNRYRRRIWMVETDGGEPWAATSAEVDSSSPKWSPDGRWLGFLSARHDDETQVWVLDRRGGEARALTEVKQGVSDFAWSPDGKRMVLVIQDAEPEREEDEPQPPYVIDRIQFKQDYAGYLSRRREHLYVLDLEAEDPAEPRQITSGDHDDSSPAWSPDGDRIAFSSNRTEEPDLNYDSDIWLVDADAASADSELTKVSTSTGSDASPTWSPDGTRLAWLTSIRPDVGGYSMSHVAVAEPGQEPRVLSEAVDRNIYRLGFDAEGDDVLGTLETEGAVQLVAFPADGGDMEVVWGGEHVVSSMVPMADGGAVVTASTPGTPADVWIVDSRGEPRQLTHHNAELLAEVRMGAVVKERHTGPDGTALETFYTFPPGVDPEAVAGDDGQRLPAILWIHGGPQGQDDWSFYVLRQLYAAHGYMVIQPNYRGSHGYGQEFALGLWQDWGGPERMDVLAGVDHAIERGWADPDRLGVGGWSYGAITTNSVITHTDRFKAAVSGAGSALYVASWGHDQYQRWYAQELGLPWENRELWERISPFNRVQHITTPTLWIGGEEDWNVPIQGGEMMYLSMRRLGRDTKLVVYPGQYHGGFPPKYERDRYLRFLGWYGKHIRGDDSLWPEWGER